MVRAARILLIEPEETARRDLDWHLEQAGHEVASVPDATVARTLLGDGLDPDVVVTGGTDSEAGISVLAPHAAHLRLRDDPGGGPGEPGVPDDPATCSRDPSDVLRRVEEILLDLRPRPCPDMTLVCLDLARRLASALPKARSAEERCVLVLETFDAYFDVLGSLVIRRSPSVQQWMEAARGLDEGLARAVSEELARRTWARGLRPFMTRLDVGGVVHEVAGLPIQSGSEETDLALVLSRAPEAPALRQALVSLVGTTLRGAMNRDELDRARGQLDAQARSTASLFRMSREFTRIGSRELLGEAILRVVRRDVQVSRSALFLRRRSAEAMFAPIAVAGVNRLALEHLGLSDQYGVGAACLTVRGLVRLATLKADGVTARELHRLGDADLPWAVVLGADDRPSGILFLGSRQDGCDLGPEDLPILEALAEAAAVAMRNLERVEELRDVAVSSLQGLAAASEMRRPSDRGHADRVARSAVVVGRALGLAPRDLRDLALAGLLHDVGKILMPPAACDQDADSVRWRMHPVTGSRILARGKPSPAVVQAVEQHHERWDGLGYPYGLRGDQIHLFARILSIADSYDRWLAEDGQESPEPALRRLELGAGLLFDPGLAALFVAEVVRSPRPDPDAGDWLEDVVAAP